MHAHAMKQRTEPERRLSAADPLAELRADHRRLLDAAVEVDGLLSERALSADERLALDAAMRLIRELLPQHLVKEEFTLYPEVAAAEARAAGVLHGLKERHMVVEEDFARLQAFVLAFDLGELSEPARRKAARAARAFRASLSALVALEEQEAFAAASRSLAPEALGRLDAAFRAQEIRERMKKSQMR